MDKNNRIFMAGICDGLQMALRDGDFRRVHEGLTELRTMLLNGLELGDDFKYHKPMKYVEPAPMRMVAEANDRLKRAIAQLEALTGKP